MVIALLAGRMWQKEAMADLEARGEHSLVVLPGLLVIGVWFLASPIGLVSGGIGWV